MAGSLILFVRVYLGVARGCLAAAGGGAWGGMKRGL